MISLKNKVIIITGASAGLGKEIAKKAALESCHLILAARNINKLNDVATEIQQKHPNTTVLAHRADVTNELDVCSLFTTTMGKFGKIDILINNAGCGYQKSIDEISLETWDHVIITNLTSVFLCSKKAIQCFKQQKQYGHIITVCSIAGLYGAPRYACYCAAKHAVAGFTRVMRLETRKHGMRTTTIYPTRLATDFFENYEKKPSDKQLLPPAMMAEYIVLIMREAKIAMLLKQLKILSKRICMLLK